MGPVTEHVDLKKLSAPILRFKEADSVPSITIWDPTPKEPLVENEDPLNANERTDKDDPRIAESNTLNGEPSNAKPLMEIESPVRTAAAIDVKPDTVRFSPIPTDPKISEYPNTERFESIDVSPAICMSASNLAAPSTVAVLPI